LNLYCYYTCSWNGYKAYHGFTYEHFLDSSYKNGYKAYHGFTYEHFLDSSYKNGYYMTTHERSFI